MREDQTGVARLDVLVGIEVASQPNLPTKERAIGAKSDV